MTFFWFLISWNSRPCLNHPSLEPFIDHKHDRSKQRVYLEEEDVELIIIGYRYRQYRLYLYYLMSVLSFGIVFLLGRWMPQRFISFVAETCELSKAECVVVQVKKLLSKLAPVLRIFLCAKLTDTNKKQSPFSRLTLCFS